MTVWAGQARPVSRRTKIKKLTLTILVNDEDAADRIVDRLDRLDEEAVAVFKESVDDWTDADRAKYTGSSND